MLLSFPAGAGNFRTQRVHTSMVLNTYRNGRSSMSSTLQHAPATIRTGPCSTNNRMKHIWHPRVSCIMSISYIARAHSSEKRVSLDTHQPWAMIRNRSCILTPWTAFSVSPSKVTRTLPLRGGYALGKKQAMRQYSNRLLHRAISI